MAIDVVENGERAAQLVPKGVRLRVKACEPLACLDQLSGNLTENRFPLALRQAASIVLPAARFNERRGSWRPPIPDQVRSGISRIRAAVSMSAWTDPVVADALEDMARGLAECMAAFERRIQELEREVRRR